MNDKAKIDSLRAALIDERTWLEDQRKAISKGCGSSWDMMQCSERINLIDAALTADASEQAPEHANLWALIDAYADQRATYQFSTVRHLAKTQRENVEHAKAELAAALAAPTAPVATPVEFTPGAEGAFDTDTKLPRLPQWFLSMLEREGRSRITIDHKGQHWNVVKAEAAPVADARAVAWLHTMDNTEGIKGNKPWKVLTFTKANPFGKPGRDYSKEYPVTSEPLIRPTQTATTDSAADARDAARYRALRSNPFDGDISIVDQRDPANWCITDAPQISGEELDRVMDMAIDAAMHHTTGKEE